jgi:hypothetical protein
MTPGSSKRGALLLTLLASALLAMSAGASSASASSGWWLINQSFAPTKPAPGKEAVIVVSAVNGGFAPISAKEKVTLTDTLPAGVELLPGRPSEPSPAGEAGQQLGNEHHPKIILECTTSGQTISCPLVNVPAKGKKPATEYNILPGESLRLRLRVKITAAAGASLTNEAKVTGGSIPPSEASRETTEVSETPEPWSAESFTLRPENDDGSLDTQAGSHPFQLSTNFNLSKNLFPTKVVGAGAEINLYGSPALAKNLHFTVPPGLIGNVANTAKCSGADFNSFLNGGLNLCPANTAVGVGSVTVLLPGVEGDYTQSVPIFNLVPDPGEPARFGFEIRSVPVVLTTRVKTGSDYGVEVSVHYATEAAAVLNSQVILWGVPGDTRHNSERGWACLSGGYQTEGLEPAPECEPEAQEHPQAFLTLPTVCEGRELPKAEVTGESWPHPGAGGAQVTATFSRPFTFESNFTGCEELKFEPSITVKPDESSASTPTGVNVQIKIPQASTLSATELGEADIRQTTLQLPEGMMSSGGAANGLEACNAGQIGFVGFGETLSEQLENNKFTPNAASCQDTSKVGTVRINTPLLERELHGSVYLARVDTAPFTSPLVLYIVAEDPVSGVLVKLAGAVSINETTGQLTSTFGGTPPLPFSELELHLFDGGRATQSTPDHCGTYRSAASFIASSSTVAHPVSVAEEPAFAITSGPGGGACPAAGALPFGTPVTAGPANTQGGAFSDFVVTLERPDGNQPLKAITVHEPPGAAAMLSSVEPCPTAVAEAAEPNCPESSKVGVSTAWAGLGGEPVALGGEVYLTGPYHGAPFGLLDVTNAEKVGPFDLGRIPVLSTINVDQTTAAATITSNPLPLFASLPGHPGASTGVPSQIKQLVIDVNRPGFTFNPTNCEGKTIGIETSGYEGGTFSKAVPFQASGCGSLPFKPTISVNVESDYSRLDGTGMKIKLTSGKGQANIKLTKLVFPNTVPSRLTTIQKACPVQTFEKNPATCPEGSVIGSAVAHTPVLKSPLTGPAYLVSHANESFPDAVFVLQGEGIKLILDGKTNIKNGVTSSTFSTVPDAPVETFEVSLPRGPHSAFSGFGNLCEKPIEVPTTFGGQNGALIEGTTHVTVEKCASQGKLGAKKESELAKLLKQCKKAKKHKVRVKCEATAHKRVKAMNSCKAKNKKSKKKLASCEAKARKAYVLKLK